MPSGDSVRAAHVTGAAANSELVSVLTVPRASSSVPSHLARAVLVAAIVRLLFLSLLPAPSPKRRRTVKTAGAAGSPLVDARRTRRCRTPAFVDVTRSEGRVRSPP